MLCNNQNDFSLVIKQFKLIALKQHTDSVTLVMNLCVHLPRRKKKRCPYKNEKSYARSVVQFYFILNFRFN